LSQQTKFLFHWSPSGRSLVSYIATIQYKCYAFAVQDIVYIYKISIYMTTKLVE